MKFKLMFFLLLILANTRVRCSKIVDITSSAGIYYRATAVGDFNGDGKPDYLFGASDGSAVYLIFGTDTLSDISVSSTGEFTGGFKIAGPSGTQFGKSIALADVDNDGKADLIIGSPSETGNGAIYIIFGSDQITSGFSVNDASFPTIGVKIPGPWGEYIGTYLTAGKINNDNYADIIVGGWTLSNPVLYIIFGNTKSFFRNTPPTLSTSGFSGGAIIAGTTTNFGYSLACVGDVDGDSYNDIAISSSSERCVYLVSGSVLVDGASISVSSNSGVTKISGDPSSAGSFGWTVGSLGDIDGDHKPDFMIGSPIENNNDGAVYLILSTNFQTSGITVSSSTHTPGVIRIRGENSSSGMLGWTVSSVNSLTTSQYADFMLAAPFYRAYRNGVNSVGAVFLISGSKGFNSDFSVSFTTAVPGVTLITGVSTQNNFGITLKGFNNSVAMSSYNGIFTIAKCVSCTSSQYRADFDICVDCSTIHQHCTSCSDSSTCTAAATGYFISGGAVVSCQTIDPKCATCNDAHTCTAVSNGYYIFGGDWISCKTLDPSCTSCSNSITCTACSNGLVPSGWECVSPENSNSNNKSTVILSSSKRTLSTGQIVGIVIGSVLFILILILIGVVIWKLRPKTRVPIKVAPLKSESKLTSYPHQTLQTDINMIERTINTDVNTISP